MAECPDHPLLPDTPKEERDNLETTTQRGNDQTRVESEQSESRVPTQSEQGKHDNKEDNACDRDECEKIVRKLFSGLKLANRDDQVTHQNLLHLVLERAPSLVAALNTFKLSELSALFASEEEKVDFFVNFFEKARKNQGEKKKSLRAKLVEFYQMPEKIREKFRDLLYSTLLVYAKSDDELKDEDIQVVVQLILSIKDFGIDEFIKILMQLSTSKSVSRQDLVLEILRNKLFEKQWLEILLEKKVDICKSWVISRVMNVEVERESSLDNLGKIVSVYKSIEAIMRCSLNVSINKILAQEVSARVVERIFETKDALSVLEASADIEKLSPVVQECYISHVKKILTPDLIKKSSHVLTKYSGSRYVLLFL